MTVLWSVGLALEVALLAVFALVVVASLLTDRRRREATVSAYPHRAAEQARARDRRAA